MPEYLVSLETSPNKIFYLLTLDQAFGSVHPTPPITKKNMQRFCFVIGGFSLKVMYL